MQFIECVNVRVEHRPGDDEYFMITRIEYAKYAQEGGAAVIETALDVSTFRTRLGPRTTTLPPFATYESTSTTLSSFLIVRNHKNNLEALGTQRSKAGSTSKKTTHPSSRSTKQNPEEQRGKSKLTWRRIAVEFRRTCEFVCLCISRLQ